MMFFVMKSSWILNWASSSPDMFHSSSKEIYHRLSQRHENSSDFAHNVKKKTPVKNTKPPSGLGAKLHVHSVFLRDSTRTHRLRLQTMSQKVTRPIAVKWSAFFSIPGAMFWKYIFTETNSKLNSTPLQNVSLHAHLPWCTSVWLPPCNNQFFITVN